MSSAAIIGISGFKNSGKTTLVVNLVAEMTRRGYVVSTVKHAHHAFDLDQPGRDSYRHREAGAREVAIVSGNRWALMHELDGEDEPSFEDVIARLAPCDIVFVEGYKKESQLKIEVREPGLDHPKLWPDDTSVIAIACDEPLEGDIPVFRRDAIQEIADFVETRFELRQGK